MKRALAKLGWARAVVAFVILLYLAAFVAFNTIIFVGLSIAALLLWPRSAIPAEVAPAPNAPAYLRRRRYGRFTQREYERLSELTDNSRRPFLRWS
jgi:hypothetical protein